VRASLFITSSANAALHLQLSKPATAAKLEHMFADVSTSSAEAEAQQQQQAADMMDSMQVTTVNVGSLLSVLDTTACSAACRDQGAIQARHEDP